MRSCVRCVCINITCTCVNACACALLCTRWKKCVDAFDACACVTDTRRFSCLHAGPKNLARSLARWLLYGYMTVDSRSCLCERLKAIIFYLKRKILPAQFKYFPSPVD
ncbi:hypothetical protein F5146DRAFT_502466 [Armillaria mellea]|nr:hypothetical protein F5146DRAFT_502466 [Armillaria mellea]